MLPVGEARSAHHHVLQQAEVGHLVLAAGVVEQNRRLHVVGLYASHVIRLLEGRERDVNNAAADSHLHKVSLISLLDGKTLKMIKLPVGRAPENSAGILKGLYFVSEN